MAKNDFVQTPRYVTEALIANESFSGTILEPCCGKGAISKVLSTEYDNVCSSDKFDYGFGDKLDLFDITDKYDNVITNPPFTQQQLVKKHLLSITTKKLALLWYVKNAGNEIEAKTSRHLKTIYVFQSPIQWEEVKLGWKFAWYVWDKSHNGNITVVRLP